jgi:hypothetical protein
MPAEPVLETIRDRAEFEAANARADDRRAYEDLLQRAHAATRG